MHPPPYTLQAQAGTSLKNCLHRCDHVFSSLQAEPLDSRELGGKEVLGEGGGLENLGNKKSPNQLC